MPSEYVQTVKTEGEARSRSCYRDSLTGVNLAPRPHAAGRLGQMILMLNNLYIFLRKVSPQCVLHRAHFKHGVKAEHYSLFNNAIVATMEASLGDAWDEEQEEAWAALSSILMSVVSKAYAGGASLQARLRPCLLLCCLAACCHEFLLRFIGILTFPWDLSVKCFGYGYTTQN
jgi:hypothetical protein